jgi:putative ABC transport system substrate-binding protein
MQFDRLKRRQFFAVFGGAATWPFAARAQQPEQVRRIGVLMNRAADDPEGQAGVAAFRQRLQQLGWADVSNVRIDTRWGADDVDRERRYAVELIALAPDIVLASGTMSVAALQNVTRTLPIVFVNVTDPVGSGLVDALARPGGNITGFMNFEYSFGGKLLEFLKQIAPNITRAAVVKTPASPVDNALFGAIQAGAPSIGVEVSTISVRDAGEIERAVATFAQSGNGGLLLIGNASASVHRNLIIALAARYKLPAAYTNRSNVIAGGLMTYGPDRIDQFRRAASYVDRILKGEKPAVLPVQAPTKYELVINIKTAKALGLTVPDTLLATATEVIEKAFAALAHGRLWHEAADSRDAAVSRYRSEADIVRRLGQVASGAPDPLRRLAHRDFCTAT